MAGREDVFKKAMNDGHSAAWDQMWERAVASYRVALEEMPDNPKALNSLALALFQLQNYEESLQLYQRVAKITTDDPVPLEKIAQICERIGRLNEAIQAAFAAAEMYFQMRDVTKSVENWLRVTQLSPEHINAHSRLALVHEKTGQTKQAVTEYIAVASLLQNSGNPQKALELIDHAISLAPDNMEAHQARKMIQAGQTLPKPIRAKGGTGPLRMAQVKQLDSPKQVKGSGLDPIEEARQKALNVLAQALFEFSDDSPDAQQRRGLQAMMRGTGHTGQLSMQQDNQTRILLHLSTAIDLQTKNNEAQAAEELEKAAEAGFKHPALYFDLGYIRSKSDRIESALRNMQHCTKHNDYSLGAHLLSGELLSKMGKTKEASNEYFEALKLADLSVVQQEYVEQVRQLYEPLSEAQDRETDANALSRLCTNIRSMLLRKDWRDALIQARTQLPKGADGTQAVPIAETLIQAQSSNVLEAMSSINQLARNGYLRSAMDEAFHAIQSAPTYLPLHTLMGDLLIREGRTPEAIAKFTTVARAYSVRGETPQATNIFRRIKQLSPMDLSVRTRLIDQLNARGQIDEAIAEYIELADIYYRLAELDMARKTYTNALRLSQQPNANHEWNVRILHRMADIDMQRLDWKQAVRIFEQIRTLTPDDDATRRSLVEVYMRLGQPQQMAGELESYTTYLEANGQQLKAATFVESLLSENPEQIILRRSLAEVYRRAGRIEDAVAQLDTAANALLDAGDKNGARDVVNQILSMNPPNAADYRQVLATL